MGAEEFAFLVGIVLPPVIAFIRGTGLAGAASTFLSLAVCAVVGTAGAFVTGDVVVDNIELNDLDTVVPAIIAAFSSSTIIYNVWFKRTEANEVAKDRDIKEVLTPTNYFRSATPDPAPAATAKKKKN